MREQAEYAGHTEEFNQRFLKTAPDIRFSFFIRLIFFFLTQPLNFQQVVHCGVGSQKKGERERELYCLLAASDLEEESRVGNRTGNLLHIHILKIGELTGSAQATLGSMMSLETARAFK